MKCPNDKTEMEKGELISQGGVWWTKGWNIFGKGIVAYKCPKCGKIELKIKTKEEKK